MIRKWTELMVGIILIISPWVFGFSDISVARWCNVFAGLILVLVSASEVFGMRPLAPAVSGEPEPKKRKQTNNVEK